MWYWRGKRFGLEWPLSSIPDDWKKVGHFIAVGKLQDPEQIDYNLILNDLDRLLPLYQYVEGGETLGTALVIERPDFEFFPRHSRKKRKTTTAVLKVGTAHVSLRHNELQDRLYDHLVEQHGKDNVGTEVPAGRRKRIDAVVRDGNRHTLYEIKTSSCVEACIREALAQLIEYSYWVDKAGEQVEELVIVSENQLTDPARGYLAYLARSIELPLTYRQVRETGELVDG